MDPLVLPHPVQDDVPGVGSGWTVPVTPWRTETCRHDPSGGPFGVSRVRIRSVSGRGYFVWKHCKDSSRSDYVRKDQGDPDKGRVGPSEVDARTGWCLGPAWVRTYVACGRRPWTVTRPSGTTTTRPFSPRPRPPLSGRPGGRGSRPSTVSASRRRTRAQTVSRVGTSPDPTPPPPVFLCFGLVLRVACVRRGFVLWGWSTFHKHTVGDPYKFIGHRWIRPPLFYRLWYTWVF